MNNRNIKKVLRVMSIFNFIQTIAILKMLQIVKKVDREEIVNKEKSLERSKIYYKLVYEWFAQKNQNKSIVEFFNKYNINRIAIYGKGSLGELLFQELEHSSINIVCFIEQNSSTMFQTEYEIPIVNIKEFTILKPNIDAIIITPVHIYDSIKDELSSLKGCDKIISLEDVIYKNV